MKTITIPCLEAFNHYSQSHASLNDYLMMSLYGNNPALTPLEDMEREECNYSQWTMIDVLLHQTFFGHKHLSLEDMRDCQLEAEDIHVELKMPDVQRIPIGKTMGLGDKTNTAFFLYDVLPGITGKTGLIWEVLLDNDNHQKAEIDPVRYSRSIRWRAILWATPELNAIDYHVFLINTAQRTRNIKEHQKFHFYRHPNMESHVRQVLRDFYKFLRKPPG